MFKRLKSLLFEEEVELEEEEQLDFSSLPKEEEVMVHEVVTEIVAPEEEVVEPTVKRIDVDEPPKKTVKPTPAPVVNLKKTHLVAEDYTPQSVISPMFGLTEAEMQKSIQMDSYDKKRPDKSVESTVISPMFGQLNHDDSTSLPKKKKQPKKDQKVNMTLEEMLNIENQEEMEFTLFDVALDSEEFQSRENNKFIDVDQSLDETDGLKIMKGDN